MRVHSGPRPKLEALKVSGTSVIFDLRSESRSYATAVTSCCNVAALAALLSVANQFIRTPMFHQREARSCSILLGINSCTSSLSEGIRTRSAAKRNSLVDCPEKRFARAFPDMRCADDGTKLGSDRGKLAIAGKILGPTAEPYQCRKDVGQGK